MIFLPLVDRKLKWNEGLDCSGKVQSVILERFRLVWDDLQALLGSSCVRLRLAL